MYFPGALTGKYKLVRVQEVHPDENGLVRTVSIIYRKRHAKERDTEIRKNSVVKERVGVQRLVLIQPANEQLRDLNDCSLNSQPRSVSNVVPTTDHGQQGPGV